MKKIALFLVLCICLTACKGILDDAFKNKAVEKITITGKVMDEDGNPMNEVTVDAWETSFMTYQIIIARAWTNKSGEFNLVIHPRQEEDFWGSYYLTVSERNYRTRMNTYDIDKLKSEQYFDIVLLPIEPNDSINSDKSR